ncbi:unnamed protein product [Urochloa humidicola]
MAEAVIIANLKIGAALGDEDTAAVILKLSRKVTNLRELPEKIEHIRRELSMIRRQIEHSDPIYQSNVVKLWIAEVRKLAFRIEDSMDKCLYHAKGGSHRILKTKYCVKAFAEVADEVVKEFREVHQLPKLRMDWFPVNLLIPRWPAEIEERISMCCMAELVQDEDLVGIYENRRKLLEMLSSDELQMAVITVSGMGGLGKTTLVQKVYEREKFKYPFHAWITVSQKYTIESFLRGLLRLIRYTDRPSVSMEKMDVHDLKQEIKSLIASSKILVVLDDVWDEELYFRIHDIFNCVQVSRIIITTRRDDIASLAPQDRHIRLKPLGSPDAFNLFCRRAFNNTADRKCPRELEDVATSIVERCKGLPLPIIYMGSLISSENQTKHAWDQVYNHFRSKLAESNNVMSILKHSYNDLPGDLRICFLYCSLFPENYIMLRENLVRQWVAEGFAITKEENTPEDVAELNLAELITRNMLQVVDYDELGRVNTCMMHSIVRELALSIAEDEKFGFANDQDTIIKMDGGARRLSVYGWKDSVAPIVKFPHLRTLFSLDGGSSTHQMLTSIFSESIYLTVLELQHSGINEVPASIGNLFCLRYIGLRHTGVKSLPESIEKLSNLQTLDMKHTKIEKLPRGIVKIQKLRHLLADRAVDENEIEFRCFAGVQPPKDLSKLQELQTLETVDATNGLVDQLDQLNLLQNVCIDKVSAMHSAMLFASLSKLRLLSSLLVNAIDENDALPLEGLNPQSTQFHRLIIRGRWAAGTLQCPIFWCHGRNLKYLALSWSGLYEDPLQLLAPHVPNLTYLSLNKVSSVHTLVISEGSFPLLKMLVLKNLFNVNLLTIGMGALQNLERLHIMELPKLNNVPGNIELLCSLKELWLLYLHNDFKAQWDRVGMDQKMAHVLELRI